NALSAAVLTAALAISSQALARAPAPLVPTALVEDVKSASADVEFMDYVGTGQVIKLEPSDVLVLSYLKSCEHETITGGTFRVGSDKSDVEGGRIVRTKVPCNGRHMKLTPHPDKPSAPSSCRLQNASFDPTVYALPPVIQIPKIGAGESRTLVIERKNRPSERFAVELDASLANGGFYDLAKTDARLRRGGVFPPTPGSRPVVFQGETQAKDQTHTRNTPAVAPRTRLPPGSR